SFVKPLTWTQKKQATQPSASSKTQAQNVSSAAPSSYTEFDTMFPTAIGDPSLLSLLEKHKVVVDVRPPASQWLLELLANWFPTLLLVGFFWWMSVNARKSQSGIFGLGRTKARRYSTDQPKVT